MVRKVLILSIVAFAKWDVICIGRRDGVRVLKSGIRIIGRVWHRCIKGVVENSTKVCEKY